MNKEELKNAINKLWLLNIIDVYECQLLLRKIDKHFLHVENKKTMEEIMKLFNNSNLIDVNLTKNTERL